MALLFLSEEKKRKTKRIEYSSGNLFLYFTFSFHIWKVFYTFWVSAVLYKCACVRMWTIFIVIMESCQLSTFDLIQKYLLLKITIWFIYARMLVYWIWSIRWTKENKTLNMNDFTSSNVANYIESLPHFVPNEHLESDKKIWNMEHELKQLSFKLDIIFTKCLIQFIKIQDKCQIL